MADISSFKIETPKNLDSIFSLDCFKYTEMKGLFRQIFEYLTRVGLKLGEFDKKLQSIPDFDSITNALKDFDRRLKDLEKRTSKNEQSIIDQKTELIAQIEQNFKELTQKDHDLESRVVILEEDVEMLKNRPIGNTDIDYSSLVSLDQFADLL